MLPEGVWRCLDCTATHSIVTIRGEGLTICPVCGSDRYVQLRADQDPTTAEDTLEAIDDGIRSMPPALRLLLAPLNAYARRRLRRLKESQP